MQPTYYAYPATTQAAPERRNDTLLVALLTALGIWLLFSYRHQEWPFDRDAQPTPIVVPDNGSDDEAKPTPIAADTWVIVVAETKGSPVERELVLNDHEFWFSLQKRGFAGFRHFDPDETEAKQFIDAAAEKSIKPPFVMIVSGGEPKATIPFPKSTAEIERLLK